MKTNPRIFIVDDDPFWTGLLNAMLQKLGFTNVRTFSNGNECVQNLQQSPRFIFLDHNMGDTDGSKMLQEIKKYNPFTCVVFCTAHQNLGAAVDAMKFGSAEYLLKENATIKEISDILENLNKEKAIAGKIY